MQCLSVNDCPFRRNEMVQHYFHDHQKNLFDTSFQKYMTDEETIIIYRIVLKSEINFLSSLGIRTRVNFKYISLFLLSFEKKSN